MKKKRNTIIPAVFLILRKNDKVLLLKRKNTGHEDGNYSLIAGHVDKDESAQFAICREAKEEAGIDINPEDLEFAYLLYKKQEEERIDIFFTTKKWQGEIKNLEPHKCAEFCFFSMNDLPENIIDYLAKVLADIQDNKKYGEFGW